MVLIIMYSHIMVHLGPLQRAALRIPMMYRASLLNSAKCWDIITICGGQVRQSCRKALRGCLRAYPSRTLAGPY